MMNIDLNRRPMVTGDQDTSGNGLLVINADDWGLDRETTDRIFECAIRQRISTASAMVFMVDSERAAELAGEAGLITGLHLNLTAPSTAKNCPPKVAARLREIASRLRKHSFSRALYYPELRGSFEYVVAAQLEEYCRLYGKPPTRLDGHHHMHLCPNVLMGKLLPAGITVRRNFSFRRGEKSALNRLYRSAVDWVLARRHVLSDLFFQLAPMEPITRVQQIFELASSLNVEVETHPALTKEYQFLNGDDMLHLTKNVRMLLPAPKAGRNEFKECRRG